MKSHNLLPTKLTNTAPDPSTSTEAETAQLANMISSPINLQCIGIMKVFCGGPNTNPEELVR